MANSQDPIELRVEYQRLNTFFSDYARNISRGGSFIATETSLGVGTEFVFVLGVPKLDSPLRLNGRVMWVTTPQDASKANPAGMGIEFQYDDDAERKAIQDRVEALMSTELGTKITDRLLGKTL
jgi:type IV pilus assembly protein PilZ